VISTRRALVPWLLAGLFSTQAAKAHVIPRSSSEWLIESNLVRVTYLMPQTEVDRVTRSTDGNRAVLETLTDYLRKHFRVTRDGRACGPKNDPVVTLHAGEANATLEWDFDCTGQGAFELTSDAFFDVSPSHVNLARVSTEQTLLAEFAFTRGRPSHVIQLVDGASGRLRTAIQFFDIGVWHIATGPDHLAFLAGLLLLAKGVRRILALTTGFTVGHSLTLLLVTVDVIRPHSQVVEALVAFTVLFVGVEALGERLRSRGVALCVCLASLLVAFAATPHSGPALPHVVLYAGLGIVSFALCTLSVTHPATRSWTQFGITVAFGLIHGMAFAAGLQELRVVGQALAPALVGFNAGVECGQIMMIMMVLILCALIAKLSGSFAPQRFAIGASTVLSCLGAWWFVNRMVAI
jgi:hypothetical protein